MTDESWTVWANMVQGWRAAGGRLTVNGGQVGFRPHWFDRLTRAKRFELPLADIESIEVVQPAPQPFTGGFRRRLRLCARDGSEVLFVVNRVELVATQLAKSAVRVGADPRLEL